MKIGIVTLIGEYNYGNLLQSYALQTILERMGHNVCILNRRVDYPNLRSQFFRVMSFFKSLFRRYILGKKEILIVNPFTEYYCTNNRVDCSELEKFVAKYLKRTSPLRSLSEMKKYDQKEQIDAYVVGSDQVWREEYTQSIEEMFLSFISGNCKAKRIAYAASFGIDDNPISSEKLSVCVDLLKRFNAVSVRESSAIDICQNIFGVESVHVLDPTMLLTVVDYKAIFEKLTVSHSSRTLLTYVLDEDEEIRSKIAQFAKEQNLELLSVNALENIDSLSCNYRRPSLEAWLRGFYDAEFVITDSFHACVFSIIFNKPFVCLGNKERGNTRFDSLLRMFGLQDRLVYDIRTAFHQPIDWKPINELLEQKQRKSIDFLRKALYVQVSNNNILTDIN